MTSGHHTGHVVFILGQADFVMCRMISDDCDNVPTKWSLSLPPGGRDCWLPHDFGCWTLLAARWWSGVDNNNNNVLASCVIYILFGFRLPFLASGASDTHSFMS